jgi:hypothetical protein
MEDTTKADTKGADLATVATPPKAEGEHHVEAPAVPLAPQIINGIKVYPTSYIPIKGVLHEPKKMLVKMDLIHIEAIHIVCFVGITIFLLIGMWKRPDLR